MIVADERVAQFVSNQLQFGLCPPWTTIGIEREGQITAGVIINHFEGDDAHFTVAGKGWTRGFMKAFGQYVFGNLGCLRVTAITEQPEVVRLAIKMGGQIEGSLRNHFGKGRDGIVIGILAEEYRFS